MENLAQRKSPTSKKCAKCATFLVGNQMSRNQTAVAPMGQLEVLLLFSMQKMVRVACKLMSAVMCGRGFYCTFLYWRAIRLKRLLLKR